MQLQACLSQVMGKHDLHTMMMCMVHWRDQMMSKATLASVLCRCVQQALLHALLHWQCTCSPVACTSSSQLKLSIQLALAQTVANNAQLAMHTWRMAVYAQHNIVCTAMKHWCMGVVGVAWCTWRQKHVEGCNWMLLLHHGVGHILHMAVGKAMATWSEQAKQCRHIRGLIHDAMNHNINQSCLMALMQWQRHTSNATQMSIFECLAVVLLKNTSLRQCW